MRDREAEREKDRDGISLVCMTLESTNTFPVLCRTVDRVRWTLSFTIISLVVLLMNIRS